MFFLMFKDINPVLLNPKIALCSNCFMTIISVATHFKTTISFVFSLKLASLKCTFGKKNLQEKPFTGERDTLLDLSPGSGSRQSRMLPRRWSLGNQ